MRSARAKPESVPVTYASESEMILALRDYFDPKEYVVLPQVRNAAGFDATRTADAIVMSTWPSRGLMLYGVEIKVSRGDWLREQKKPEKSDEIASYCDHWVVAVGSSSIIKIGELPAAWGLLEPGKKPGSLRMTKPPAKIDARPMSRTFLARILRKTLEVAVPLANVDAEIDRRVALRTAELEAGITKRITRELDPDGVVEQNRKLIECVDAFKEITGVWLGAYDHEKFRQLAKVFKLMEWSGIEDWITGLRQQCKRTIDNLDILFKALPPEQRK